MSTTNHVMTLILSGLRPCPERDGRHRWIMHAAHVCARAGMGTDAAVAQITSMLTRSPRPNEIEDALKKAEMVVGASGCKVSRTNHARTSPVAFDAAVLARVAAKLPEATPDWIVAKSPVPPQGLTPAIFLKELFQPGEHALVFTKFKSQGQVIWTNDGAACPELDVFQTGQPEGVWFLSNPVDGIYHQVERLRKPSNPAGTTRRAEENITNFRYALIESDDAPPEPWLRALCQMPLPIVSIVGSGGKSMHALVRINANSKAQWDELVRGRLLRPLTVLGADPAAMSAVRLTRLPGCLRYGKQNSAGQFESTPGGPRLQPLLFLNPAADGTPIADLTKRGGS